MSTTAAASAIRHVQQKIAAATTAIDACERGLSIDTSSAEKHINEAEADLVEALGGRVSSGSGSGGLAGKDRQRAEQLLDECKDLRTAVERLRRKHKHIAQQQAERDALRRHTATAAAAKTEMSCVSALAKEEQALKYTSKKVAMLTEESQAVLGALRGQKKKLVGSVGGKLGDFIASVGVSGSTIAQIARTNRVDAAIVYGGIALLMLLMIYLWFW